MDTKHLLHRRLNYANFLSATLENAFNEWSGYQGNIKLEHSSSKKHRVVTSKIILIREPDYVYWGLLLGMLSHTLRSTLDNLVYALSTTKTEKNQFPIFLNETDYTRNETAYLSGVSSEIRNHIRARQPFNFTPSYNHPLRLLQELNNADKHRIPKFLLVRPKDFHAQLSIEFDSEESRCEPVLIFNDEPIQSGAWLVKYHFKFPFKKLTDSSVMQFQGQVEINGRHYSIKQLCSELLKEVFEITNELGSFLK